MILGILSDSHGRHRRTARAIRLLQDLGAEAFVHCGDLGGKAVLNELTGRRVWFVWGNTDVGTPLLSRYAQQLGLAVPEGIPLCLELAGRSIAVFHGHEPQFTGLARLIRSERIAEFEALLETLVRESPLVRESVRQRRAAPMCHPEKRSDEGSTLVRESLLVPQERRIDAGASPDVHRDSRTTRYVLYGHSHRATDLRVGRVRLINPGALDRARPATVATLDLKRDVVRFWQVDDHAAEADPPRRFKPH